MLLFQRLYLARSGYVGLSCPEASEGGFRDTMPNGLRIEALTYHAPFCKKIWLLLVFIGGSLLKKAVVAWLLQRSWRNLPRSLRRTSSPRPPAPPPAYSVLPLQQSLLQ
jgi:hypothetical protein